MNLQFNLMYIALGCTLYQVAQFPLDHVTSQINAHLNESQVMSCNKLQQIFLIYNSIDNEYENIGIIIEVTRFGILSN